MRRGTSVLYSVASLAFPISLVVAQNTEPRLNIEVVPALTAVPPYPGIPVLAKVALASKAAGPATDSVATGVFKSATHLYQRFLTLQLPDPDSMATLTRDGQDILIARWHGGQLPSGILSALLWDDPSYTSLLLRLPAETLQTPEHVDVFLKGLFQWQQIRTLYVYLSSARYPNREFLRGGFTFPRDSDLGPDIILAAVPAKSGDWFSVRFHRTASNFEFDKGMSYISERFPPFRSRIGAWTRPELIAALGKKEDLFERNARDTILIEELIARPDLTDHDFREMIDHEDTTLSREYNLPKAITEALRHGCGVQFIPVMIEYFRSSKPRDPMRAEVHAGMLLFDLKSSARPEYCPLVVLFLNDHLAVEDSLKYAAQFCLSREAYDAVASLDDNGKYSKARADALDQIGKQLGIAPR